MSLFGSYGVQVLKVEQIDHLGIIAGRQMLLPTMTVALTTVRLKHSPRPPPRLASPPNAY